MYFFSIKNISICVDLDKTPCPYCLDYVNFSIVLFFKKHLCLFISKGNVHIFYLSTMMFLYSYIDINLHIFALFFIGIS